MNNLKSSTQRATVPIRLERDVLIDLARPAPLRLLLQVGIEWLCIILLIMAASYCSSLSISILCILLIATRQHALLTLMHEFSHYQLSRKHPWLNDIVGDIFTAFPFFITIYGFRRNHMPHHWHVSTECDPNWVASSKKARFQFPKTRRQVWIEVLKHGTGFYTFDELRRYTVSAGMSVNLPLGARIPQIVFAVVVAALATYFHLWPTLLLYWLLPLSTFLMAILYIRDIGEHYGMPAPGILGSRTVRAGWLDRLLFCQNGVNFHAEHHLFPSVPFFRLAQLHRHLLENVYYQDHAVITQGYLTGLVTEVSLLEKNSVLNKSILSA